MKKNMIRCWIAWAVVLVAYHVVVFAVPFPKTQVFVVCYLFTLAALGAQVYVFYTAFARGAGAKSKFYGWPIARVGALYLVVQLILGLVFMGLGTVLPVWVPVVLFVLLLSAAAIGVLSTTAVRDEIYRQDVKLQKDVSCMRALQSLAGTLPGQIQDPVLMGRIRAFSEALRYSDPVSSEAIRPIEMELTGCMEEVQKAIVDGDYEGADALLKRANDLLAERNRLCKLNKSTVQ